MSRSRMHVIDNEPQLVDLLCRIAQLTGIDAIGHTEAADFFDELQDGGEVELLVLDLHMPGMDGIEVMRRLTELDHPPAVILVSGHDIGVLHAAEKLGQAHNLEILASFTKPVPMMDFRALLQRYANRPSAVEGAAIQTGDYADIGLELQAAIDDDQLVAHYQPQIDIRSGDVVGVEALVRWNHPEHGLLPPNLFVPLAEQLGIISGLTNFMLAAAIDQVRQWLSAGVSLRTSVNVSSIDLTVLALPERVEELLGASGLEPGLLMLEMTESAMMGESVTSLDTLTRLRIKDVGLSIDDFGTGFSSLSQLHRIPFNELKIDQSFVAAISGDEEARAIVRTCIMLGHELKMTVVAEGVETEEQLAMLEALGCDIAQGFLFSRALPPDQLLEWVSSRR